MEVVRGRAASVSAQRRVLQQLRAHVENVDRPLVYVWQSHPHVAFGPRDRRHDGYHRAREHAMAAELEPIDRSVGGRPVAHTEATITFAKLEPIADPRRGLQSRYNATLEELSGAMASMGVALERGEPPESFCPGTHSLSGDGKVVGLAQRVTGSVALTAGIAIVADRKRIAAVLEPIYCTLEIPFDPEQVGSIAANGGPHSVVPVRAAIERHLAGPRAPRRPLTAMTSGA